MGTPSSSIKRTHPVHPKRHTRRRNYREPPKYSAERHQELRFMLTKINQYLQERQRHGMDSFLGAGPPPVAPVAGAFLGAASGFLYHTCQKETDKGLPNLGIVEEKGDISVVLQKSKSTRRQMLKRTGRGALWFSLFATTLTWQNRKTNTNTFREELPPEPWEYLNGLYAKYRALTREQLDYLYWDLREEKPLASGLMRHYRRELKFPREVFFYDANGSKMKEDPQMAPSFRDQLNHIRSIRLAIRSSQDLYLSRLAARSNLDLSEYEEMQLQMLRSTKHYYRSMDQWVQ